MHKNNSITFITPFAGEIGLVHHTLLSKKLPELEETSSSVLVDSSLNC